MSYGKKKDAEAKRVPKKVYIDPEIVKKYNLDRQKVSGFTHRKLYTEGD
jgi:hypothetical protein